MSSKVQVTSGGRVELTLHAPQARSVAVAGDFNGWDPKALPMRAQGNGLFRVETPALIGGDFTPVRVLYKFVVDGHEWRSDPTNGGMAWGDSSLEVLPRHPIEPVPHGRVWGDGCCFSRALGKAIRYLAYLPAGYETHPGRCYPVVYFLHGYQDGGARSWLVKGHLQEILDILIGRGIIPPMIAILPEAEDSFYADKLGGASDWEKALTQDLIRHVDSALRTKANRRYRSISGVSMGGFGAIKLALQYPYLFASAHAHAGLFDVRDRDFMVSRFGEGEASDEHRKWNSPISLVGDETRTNNLRLSFDCGEKDALYSQSLAFEQVLTRGGIPHTFWSGPGYHTWDVFQRMLPHALLGHSQKMFGGRHAQVLQCG